MRLWSLHPCLLDSKGLVALWRESLLALNVLQGNTKGYKNHPQLIRFKETPSPASAVAYYLAAVLAEAQRREYNFNAAKIPPYSPVQISVTDGQLAYEFEHLQRKLETRDPTKFAKNKIDADKKILVHPMFNMSTGSIAAWERP